MKIASVAFERMVYSLAEGMLLTFVVAMALRLLPAKTSQTRFAIWLSALFGIVAVTLFGLHGASATHAMHSASLLSLPVSIALGAFALWALRGDVRSAADRYRFMAAGKIAAPVRSR